MVLPPPRSHDADAAGLGRLPPPIWAQQAAVKTSVNNDMKMILFCMLSPYLVDAVTNNSSTTFKIMFLTLRTSQCTPSETTLMGRRHRSILLLGPLVKRCRHDSRCHSLASNFNFHGGANGREFRRHVSQSNIFL